MAIRKREPLRIPQSWKDQARAFVIQLERILDDIYKRFFATEIPMSDKDSTTIGNKIDTIDRLRDLKLSGTNVTSDDFIRQLPAGDYQVSGSNKSAYIPFRYGTLSVFRSGTGNYGYVLAHQTNGDIYIRHFNDSEWHTSWEQIATTDIHGLSESKTTAATDLDNCYYAGTYLYNPTTLHIPYAGYGLCFVVATDDPSSTGVGWVNQIAISTSMGINIYVRKRINNGAWRAWEKVGEDNKVQTFYYEDKAITSGYVTLTYPTGTAYDTHVFMVSPQYKTGTTVGWSAVVQAQSNAINLYIRQGTTTPADNSKICFYLVAIKA